MFAILLFCTFFLKNVGADCTVTDRSALCESVNNIDSVSSKSSITKLEIRNSPSFDLNPSTFNEFTNLENIKLDKCEIKKVSSDSFNGLKYLKYLYLTNNKIEDIEPGVFRNLSKIDEITLDDNNLGTIRRGIFANIPLRKLNIFRNSIRDFDSESLKNLQRLEYLKLDNNLLEEFNFQDILDHPETLTVVWIRRNKLKRVTKYMLQKLTSLEYLFLDGNYINKIESGSFEDMPNLRTLDITNNKITHLDVDVFPKLGFQHLQQFLLGNNKLMFLSPELVFKLKGLKDIILLGNPWQCNCLSDIQSILNVLGIKEKCVQDFAKDGRPVCINKFVGEKCPYTYDQALATKYGNIQGKFPYYIWQKSCLNG